MFGRGSISTALLIIRSTYVVLVERTAVARLDAALCHGRSVRLLRTDVAFVFLIPVAMQRPVCPTYT
jgi:hypothetical protein